MLINRRIALVLFSCLLMTCAWAQTTRSTVTNLPSEVIEGETFTLTVNYDVDEDLGTIPLKVELKNPREMVLTGQAFNVSGTGSHVFEFVAPPRTEESEIKFAVWYGDDWRQAIGQIMHTETLRILSRSEAQEMAGQAEAANLWRTNSGADNWAGNAFAVLDDDMPGFDRARAERVIQAIKATGVNAIRLNASEFSNTNILNINTFKGAVLTTSAILPDTALRSVERFMSQGGDLIALEAPAFTQPVSLMDGKWLTSTQIADALAMTPGEQMLFDFNIDDASDWGTTSGDKNPMSFELDASGPEDKGKALHCIINNYQTWNTFLPPVFQQPITEGLNLTCLWAKGSPGTTALAVEFVEKDGSRWIATIPLTTQWKRYAIKTDAFKFWQDSSSKGRGVMGDRVNPSNAEKMTIGIAQTHTQMSGGPKEFWVAGIEMARDPWQAGGIEAIPTLPAIEPLTPAYKFYDVTTARTMQVSDKQCILPAAKLDVPAGLMSVQPRPQGTGFNKERKWRWIPLIEAYDEKGRECGTPACLFINNTGRYNGSVVATFALPAVSYENPQIIKMVADIAQRMNEGVYLTEGGAEYYAYFDDEQEVNLGARLTSPDNFDASKLTVRFKVTGDQQTQMEAQQPLTDGVVECTWLTDEFNKDTYEVTCELLNAQGTGIDMLQHPVVVWRPNPKPDFIKVENGNFMHNGQPWYAHGVNYMPSSGIGIEDGPYFELWMGKQAYDPIVIQRDLERCVDLGFNSVSIFCYYSSLDSRNLLDILERCKRLGLLANLSLRPGTPLNFEWDMMRALIETYRLAQNDTVMAYDLAWEPNWGYRDARKYLDGDWEKWVIANYGSIENAEASWGVTAPREDGKLAGATNEQTAVESEYRVMVAAYRRFLDEYLDRAHARANGLVKSVDPNHLTSFRMSMAGDPTISPAWFGYDFRGLARTVDIMEPEGYGRIGDWDRVKPGMFTADYSRAVAPGRPVLWAEFGNSSWNFPEMKRDLEREEWTGNYYRDYYRMALESDADGTFCWWYPGGFRTGENSDYGVINPDGSWRPASHAIREWADRMKAQRPPHQIDAVLTFDRDATVKGLPGIYDALQEEYWKIRESGKTPALKIAGFDYTSANAPRVAVGNVPYEFGKTPHKYLNAAIDKLEILNLFGVWQEVHEGDVVEAKLGNALMARATVGNNGEATWLAGEGNGKVWFACGEALGELSTDVPVMQTVQIEEFQVCELQGDMEFICQMQVMPDTIFGTPLSFKVVAVE